MSSIDSMSASAALGQMSATSARQDTLIDKAGKNGDRQKVRDLAQQFESVFLEIVMRSMRNTVTKSELMDGGNAEEIYKSMLDSEYSKTMAGSGMSQLALDIERQLLENMGVKPEISQIGKGQQGRASYGVQALHPEAKQATILSGKRF